MAESFEFVTYTVAIIPTHNRPEELEACLRSIRYQVDRTIIIDNRSDPDILARGIQPEDFGPGDAIIRNDDDPPNIQKLWNTGLDYFRTVTLATNPPDFHWNALILNDDVIVPDGFINKLDVNMRATTAVLAYPDQFDGQDTILHTVPGPVDMRTRITGYAYILRGETGVRLDERFGWWYGDDDLDWRCRQMGGSLLVPGIPVQHTRPNESIYRDPRLAEQTGVDRKTFIDKWGMAPH
jgi:glycosyltransferase involved in cell wall biosynthesis